VTPPEPGEADGLPGGAGLNPSNNQAERADAAAGAIADPSQPDSRTPWVVIIPVKPTVTGKSRLEPTPPGLDRAALARAIALDTIAAAVAAVSPAAPREAAAGATAAASDAGAAREPAPGSATPSGDARPSGTVVVVTDDPDLAAGARALGAHAIGEGTARGLDAAIATGAAWAGPARHRAALLGDMPALRPAELAAALTTASTVERAVVPDAEGTGSTLVTAAAGVPWTSAFGGDSFARHQALGCVALDVPDASSLRRDVDTALQLAAASALGLGPHTTALLAHNTPGVRL
jgi:2-phospho-L-lactate/phosphoenolpyruvate guanylyltransferase